MAGQADVVATYGVMQRRAVVQTSATVARLWAELNSSDLDGSWSSGLGMAVNRAVSAGQLVAASSGQAYVDAVMAAQGESSQYEPGATTVVAQRFSGTASDGRDLATLLYEPIIRTKTLLKGGVTLQQSMLGGLMGMQRIVDSEIADAGRGAASVGMTANRTVVGFLRQVRAGACARCVLLAGRWYRVNADFQRHKRCQCYGVPATKDRFPNHLNPMSFFNNLSRSEQDRRFGVADSQAIRDGADIYSVVNARRGVSVMGSRVDEQGFTHRGRVVRSDVHGSKLLTTSEGTAERGDYYLTARSQAERDTGIRFAHSAAEFERGLPQFKLRAPRLMPAEIYKLTEDRLELIRLLRRYGYLH